MREYGRRGEITSEVNYKDGMKHGFLRTFDSRGKVLTEREYEFGQLKVKGSFQPK
jgi:antitoxin component YwqK of YwqJK toxin-antitoxin module